MAIKWVNGNEPKFSSKSISCKASGQDIEKIRYTLQQAGDRPIDVGGPQDLALEGVASWPIEASAVSDTTYLISAQGLDGKSVVTGTALTATVSVPKSSTPQDAAAETVVFHGAYALLMAVLTLAFFGPVLYVLLVSSKTLQPPTTGSTAAYVAGVVAVGLMAVGLALGASGVYMMLVEHRGSLAGREKTRAGLSLDAKEIEALGKLKAPWAVLLAAVAVLVASAWVAGHIADSTKPTSPEATTPTTIQASPGTPVTTSNASLPGPTTTTRP
jgi:hypothetical protein